MSNSLIYQTVRLPREAIAQAHDQVASFDNVIGFQPGKIVYAEISSASGLPLLEAFLATSIREVSVRAELEESDSPMGFETFARDVDRSKPPASSVRFSLVGNGSKRANSWGVAIVAGARTFINLRTRAGLDREARFALFQQASQEALPVQVVENEYGYALVPTEGAEVWSGSWDGRPRASSPTSARVTLSGVTCAQLGGRLRHLLQVIPASERRLAWAWKIDHEPSADLPTQGNEIYRWIQAFDWPAGKTTVSLHWRLERLDQIDALPTLAMEADGQDSLIDVPLCQFAVEGEPASLSVPCRQDGLRLELEIENPEILPAIESRLGLTFQPQQIAP